MQVTPFSIEQQMDGKEVVLHPTLLQVSGKNYLVDCGYEATFDAFATELGRLGIPIEQLHGLIITHDDIDHLGALHLFKKQNSNLLVYCSRIEAPSVSGQVPSERLVQAETSFSSLPEMHQPWAAQFIRQLKAIKRMRADVLLDDGDLIEGAIQVIHTPGHTRGHISLYIPAENTLIAGDAVVIEDGSLNIANPSFTLDMQAALSSVAKIRDFQPERLICYHGGEVNDHVSEKLQDLLRRYPHQQEQDLPKHNAAL